MRELFAVWMDTAPKLDRALGVWGLEWAELKVLFCCAGQKLSNREIASKLGVDYWVTRRVIGRLLSDGLLERDNRKRFSATQSCVLLLRKIMKSKELETHLRTLAKAILAALPPDRG